VRDELPHSLAVVIEEVSPREGRDDLNPLVDVHAVLYVERDKPKGHRDRQGRRQAARGWHRRAHPDRDASRTKVYLDLRVKIAKNWQRDPNSLGASLLTGLAVDRDDDAAVQAVHDQTPIFELAQFDMNRHVVRAVVPLFMISMPLIASAGLIATVSATTPLNPAALARSCAIDPSEPMSRRVRGC